MNNTKTVANYAVRNATREKMRNGHCRNQIFSMRYLHRSESCMKYCSGVISDFFNGKMEFPTKLDIKFIE